MTQKMLEAEEERNEILNEEKHQFDLLKDEYDELKEENNQFDLLKDEYDELNEEKHQFDLLKDEYDERLKREKHQFDLLKDEFDEKHQFDLLKDEYDEKYARILVFLENEADDDSIQESADIRVSEIDENDADYRVSEIEENVDYHLIEQESILTQNIEEKEEEEEKKDLLRKENGVSYHGNQRIEDSKNQQREEDSLESQDSVDFDREEDSLESQDLMESKIEMNAVDNDGIVENLREDSLESQDSVESKELECERIISNAKYMEEEQGERNQEPHSEQPQQPYTQREHGKLSSSAVCTEKEIEMKILSFLKEEDDGLWHYESVKRDNDDPSTKDIEEAELKPQTTMASAFNDNINRKGQFVSSNIIFILIALCIAVWIVKNEPIKEWMVNPFETQLNADHSIMRIPLWHEPVKGDNNDDGVNCDALTSKRMERNHSQRYRRYQFETDNDESADQKFIMQTEVLLGSISTPNKKKRDEYDKTRQRTLDSEIQNDEFKVFSIDQDVDPDEYRAEFEEALDNVRAVAKVDQHNESKADKAVIISKPPDPSDELIWRSYNDSQSPALSFDVSLKETGYIDKAYQVNKVNDIGVIWSSKLRTLIEFDLNECTEMDIEKDCMVQHDALNEKPMTDQCNFKMNTLNVGEMISYEIDEAKVMKDHSSISIQKEIIRIELYILKVEIHKYMKMNEAEEIITLFLKETKETEALQSLQCLWYQLYGVDTYLALKQYDSYKNMLFFSILCENNELCAEITQSLFHLIESYATEIKHDLLYYIDENDAKDGRELPEALSEINIADLERYNLIESNVTDLERDNFILNPLKSEMSLNNDLDEEDTEYGIIDSNEPDHERDINVLKQIECDNLKIVLLAHLNIETELIVDDKSLKRYTRFKAKITRLNDDNTKNECKANNERDDMCSLILNGNNECQCVDNEGRNKNEIDALMYNKQNISCEPSSKLFEIKRSQNHSQKHVIEIDSNSENHKQLKDQRVSLKNELNIANEQLKDKEIECDKISDRNDNLKVNGTRDTETKDIDYNVLSFGLIHIPRIQQIIKHLLYGKEQRKSINLEEAVVSLRRNVLRNHPMSHVKCKDRLSKIKKVTKLVRKLADDAINNYAESANIKNDPDYDSNNATEIKHDSLYVIYIMADHLLHSVGISQGIQSSIMDTHSLALRLMSGISSYETNKDISKLADCDGIQYPLYVLSALNEWGDSVRNIRFNNYLNDKEQEINDEMQKELQQHRLQCNEIDIAVFYGLNGVEVTLDELTAVSIRIKGGLTEETLDTGDNEYNYSVEREPSDIVATSFCILHQELTHREKSSLIIYKWRKPTNNELVDSVARLVRKLAEDAIDNHYFLLKYSSYPYLMKMRVSDGSNINRNDCVQSVFVNIMDNQLNVILIEIVATLSGSSLPRETHVSLSDILKLLSISFQVREELNLNNGTALMGKMISGLEYKDTKIHTINALAKMQEVVAVISVMEDQARDILSYNLQRIQSSLSKASLNAGYLLVMDSFILFSNVYDAEGSTEMECSIILNSYSECIGVKINENDWYFQRNTECMQQNIDTEHASLTPYYNALYLGWRLNKMAHELVKRAQSQDTDNELLISGTSENKVLALLSKKAVNKGNNSVIGILIYNIIYDQTIKNQFIDDLNDECDTITKLYGNGDITMRMMGESALIKVMNTESRKDVEEKDTLTIPIILCVLAFIIGSWRLVLIPLLTFGASICASFSVMRPFAKHISEVNPFCPSMMMSVTIAMCIDYSLFLLTQHKEEVERNGKGLHQNKQRTIEISCEAVRQITRWSGKVIVLSGCILSLTYFALRFYSMEVLQSVGLGIEDYNKSCFGVADHSEEETIVKSDEYDEDIPLRIIPLLWKFIICAIMVIYILRYELSDDEYDYSVEREPSSLLDPYYEDCIKSLWIKREQRKRKERE